MKSNTLYVVLMLISLVLLIMDIYDGALSKILLSGLFFVSFLFFWIATLVNSATGLRKVARIILIIALLLLAYRLIQYFNIRVGTTAAG
ncbi:MAG: hypothetical protein BWX95_01348 [Bacteroidetes bacterium ADurb.Bin141]|nr:MAG: hypothetical protein BWX95_01348 [Bacteroidetes bacterium ADurb.Bin141]